MSPFPLCVSDLEIAAPDGRALLCVPHLELGPGEVLAVSGPSGAGKSTLLHAVAGLLPQGRGSVRWGGMDLLRVGDAARSAFRRDCLGFVFQENHLFEEMTALGNAELSALYAPRDRRIGIRARARAGLAAFGLNNSLRKNAGVLSGGERQRTAVARALASDPAVLLADEPTAALDRATADKVADDLFAFVRQDRRAMILVSHDPALLNRADRRVALRDGHLVEADAHV